MQNNGHNTTNFVHWNAQCGSLTCDKAGGGTHAPQILLLASRFTVPSVLTTLPFWNHQAAADKYSYQRKDAAEAMAACKTTHLWQHHPRG
jgi:hypothetical protein